jgi:hypothetical protein
MTASTALDRLQHARHASERQRAGDEPDDLTIVVALEPPDDVNRIGRRIRVVEVRVKLVEDRFQPLNLEICRSEVCNRYDSAMRRVLLKRSRSSSSLAASPRAAITITLIAAPDRRAA